MRSNDHPSDEQIARLDALLDRRGSPESRADLEPLLAAADALAPLADAQPGRAFAAQLEARLRERMGEPMTLTETTPPMEADVTPLRERADRRSLGRRGARPISIRARASWIAVAACLLIGLTVGALTLAARPGASGCSFCKIAGIGSILSDPAANSAQADLKRARNDLAAFTSAAGQGDSATAQTALAHLTHDDRQAASDIAQVKDSGARAPLEGQLASLRAQETAAMRAALPRLDWPTRVQVTNALRDRNATTLVVTGAHISRSNQTAGSEHNASAGSAHTSGPIIVTINGDGFTTGAVLLVNGAPAGSVVSVTSHALVARLPADTNITAITSVGVGSLDGSAATTTHITPDDNR